VRILFRELFTLAVTHGYYGGPCPDLRFTLPADTRRWLGNARLLARERDGVLHLLYEANAGGEPLVRAPGARLRFGLRLVSPNFPNYTQLPAGFPARRLTYDNLADPAVLSAGLRAVVGSVFAHPLGRTDRPATVTARDAAGAVVATTTLEDGDLRDSVSLDLRGQPSGRIEVEEAYPAASSSTPYYYDPELQDPDAVGVVEITVGDGFYAAPPAFEIAFLTREEALRYYLVARGYSQADFNSLAVADLGFAEEGRPEIVFDRVPVASFTSAEIAPALLAGSGERLVLFRSQDAPPRRERARRRIQLSKNGDVLIANLPQPGADRATADLIIHLSKP
jgi:hypothetical protein